MVLLSIIKLVQSFKIVLIVNSTCKQTKVVESNNTTKDPIQKLKIKQLQLLMLFILNTLPLWIHMLVIFFLEYYYHIRRLAWNYI